MKDEERKREPVFGIETIYGADGEHATPYLTRLWIGRLRLHIFHRPDADPDCHDHPWDFWTFPLTPYVEEVASDQGDGTHVRSLNVVPAFRLTYRPARHTHRVLGRLVRFQTLNESFFHGHYADMRPIIGTAKIVTIVWRGRTSRHWGFLKNRDGRWCWVGWRQYVFEGGKHAPCEPDGGAGR